MTARITVLLLVGQALTACASSRVVEHFREIRPGMKREEVVQILGEPSSRWSLTAVEDGMVGERLQWGDSLSSLASSAAFRGSPDRAYSVVLGADGTVVTTAEPVWEKE